MGIGAEAGVRSAVNSSVLTNVRFHPNLRLFWSETFARLLQELGSFQPTTDGR